jgi:glycosyltransferase involved in cell wall biosynthesis
MNGNRGTRRDSAVAVAEQQAPPLADRNLLVLSHHYKNFAKEQIDTLAGHVGEIEVVVRHNPIAEVYEYVPVPQLRTYRKASILDTSSVPENVTVTTASVLWLPFDWSRERLGDRHYRKVLSSIEANDVEFDILHAHFTWTAGYVGARLKYEYDVPFVLTVHENGDFLREEYESGDESIARTWRDADTIIRVNERDAPLLREFNDDVRSIPNGFSRDRFPLHPTAEARDHLDLPRDVPILFSLGVISERKGFQFLLEAMEDVLQTHGDVLCYVGGDGGYRSTLQRMVADRGLEDHVSFLGYIPEHELGWWMNACSVFVLPSLAEGNPTVMFEALGCGKPFVGTDVGGVGEIIDSPEYGVVCPPGDPDALADAILTALDRSWDRDVILDYADQFTWERIADQVVEVYRDCLASE